VCANNSLQQQQQQESEAGPVHLLTVESRVAQGGLSLQRLGIGPRVFIQG
jgi:hypothetical protein